MYVIEHIKFISRYQSDKVNFYENNDVSTGVGTTKKVYCQSVNHINYNMYLLIGLYEYI